MPEMNPKQVAKYKKKILNPDGSVSTVRTKTFTFTTDKGKTIFINIPTIWDGKQLTDSEAMNKAKKQGLNNFPSFNNKKDAIAASKKRSDDIGKELSKLKGKKLPPKN